MPNPEPPPLAQPTTTAQPRSNYAARLNAIVDGLVITDSTSITSLRGGWGDRFRDRIGAGFDGRITFEIGCADGAMLAAIAAEHPNTAFVGIDWKFRAIHDAAHRVTALGLANVLLVRGRAQDLRSIFADGELHEIWIFHPDPCDREVERRNRLVSEPFLLDACAVLGGAGSRLCLKTDHAEYGHSVRVLFAGADSVISPRFECIVESADLWSDASAQGRVQQRHFNGHVTRFEERFRRKHKPIFYIELSKR